MNPSPAPSWRGDSVGTETTLINACHPAICVICLERITDEVTALPCKHDQFHFSCLGTWLHQSRACPLCKQDVRAIRYHDSGGSQNIYHLSESHGTERQPRGHRCDNGAYSRRTHREERSNSTNQIDAALAFRKQVYGRQMYSLYIGSNRISRYRNVTSEIISQDDALIKKAKKWIRRELAVFDFLNPNSPTFGRSDRRATNAEFLLEYIIAIIKAIDMKGSAGQAQELLKDFLGRDNARLFLHELESWLRSPHETLKDWDDTVQYAVV